MHKIERDGELPSRAIAPDEKKKKDKCLLT
jgi:hypothetical protein